MTAATICFVVSSPLTAKAFLSGHIVALSKRYRVDLAVDADNPIELGGISAYARVIPVRIRRRIAPLADLAALLRLFVLFRRERYAAVSSVTPKAGMLALLAATMARVPRRIHIFTGQVWATRTGWKRLLLKAADRLMAHLATHVLADSPSQRDFLIAEGIVAAEKIQVLGEGSICGVDGMRFHPDDRIRTDIRLSLGIPQNAVAFLFLGRLNRDKGVLDLAEAFARLDDPAAWLLVVGPDEASLRGEMESRLGAALSRARFIGYTDRPEGFMAAADVFCLPSYREGFGMVVIEAAAAGIPAIASRIYGVTDAVADGVTGLLHQPGDVEEILWGMSVLTRDAPRRIALGLAARERVLRLFSGDAVTQVWVRFYERLLG
ncbi:MAG: glycosyltransferase family 1 protein [Betaproteobacteria bacterium HGW-Betaproteobacteria-11]|nr:MAG: glycosyltransferase family 1 protein [Betaproteobacteria bacterium HGW-Betaproteobacteria-11]